MVLVCCQQGLGFGLSALTTYPYLCIAIFLIFLLLATLGGIIILTTYCLLQLELAAKDWAWHCFLREFFGKFIRSVAIYYSRRYSLLSEPLQVALPENTNEPVVLTITGVAMFGLCMAQRIRRGIQ